MRDILFRGKTSEGDWVYGYPFVQAKGTEYEECYILGDLDVRLSIYDLWDCAEKVDSETIGQYTGIEDKNGKKIFEGDIVSVNGFDIPLFIELTDLEKEPEYASISWNCRMSGHPHYLHRLENKPSKYEVIGNIYDNPELLT